MPSLYFVIVIFGMTAGTVGPLPYDKSECENRAQEFRDHRDANHKDGITVNGREVKRGDVQFRCEYHIVRPVEDPGLREEAVASDTPKN